MSTATFPTNQAEILSRSLDQGSDRLTPDVARFFLDLELTPDDRQRVEELAAKARQGALTESESHDLEEYRRVGRVVELLKLTVRQRVE
jgi:hypothetical protein